MLEINVMIKEASGRQLEILLRLKVLNNEANLHLKQFGKKWKQKYHEMWRTPFWKEAKALLREYDNIENEGSFCHICSMPFGMKFTLHHEEAFYNPLNLFTPTFVQLLHNKCHQKHHKGVKK